MIHGGPFPCNVGQSRIAVAEAAVCAAGPTTTWSDSVGEVGPPARTLADLEGGGKIQSHHIAEAICARGILAAAFWERVRTAA